MEGFSCEGGWVGRTPLCSGVVRRDEAACLLLGQSSIFGDVLCSSLGWQEK